jgi:hypothetical protein
LPRGFSFLITEYFSNEDPAVQRAAVRSRSSLATGQPHPNADLDGENGNMPMIPRTLAERERLAEIGGVSSRPASSFVAAAATFIESVAAK